jgi:hypothetical protein
MDMPQLIEIKNGEKVKGTFSAEEMTARLAKLRAHMAEVPPITTSTTTQISSIASSGGTTAWW